MHDNCETDTTASDPDTSETVARLNSCDWLTDKQRERILRKAAARKSKPVKTIPPCAAARIKEFVRATKVTEQQIRQSLIQAGEFAPRTKRIPFCGHA